MVTCHIKTGIHSAGIMREFSSFFIDFKNDEMRSHQLAARDCKGVRR
jgi:hypothetical protein